MRVLDSIDTIVAMWGMLHAVYAVVSALIAFGMCACFTIFAIIMGMLHDSATACDLYDLADVS